MTLDYTVCGKVQITVIDFLDEVLISFDKAEPKGGGTMISAAPENLFKVDKDCEKLPQSNTVQFHNLVAKNLYATKRARQDTCMAVAFLTTRVRAPNIEYWDKMGLPLILSAKVSVILKWWVDTLFAVHPNMRGCSSGGFYLGRGFTIVSSTKKTQHPQL